MAMQENQTQLSAGAGSVNAAALGTGPVGTTGMSYQQYQKQIHMKQEQEAAMAQKAIVSAGLDSFSQQVLNTIQRLRQISQDLGNGQKQLEAQMAAQQRQVKQMQQNIENICNELQNSYKPGPVQSRLQ
ncbi:hypothetical protein [Paenibacillus thermotolerans]|uniref:hypothetical protein n=1 Tax=Paenibacillus thermotolerans TaxID=3027807 RepID=UPI002368208F|nr:MULTISPECIES: hypothetical protein [unclassified Paenibacillus]